MTYIGISAFDYFKYRAWDFGLQLNTVLLFSSPRFQLDMVFLLTGDIGIKTRIMIKWHRMASNSHRLSQIE